MSLPGLGEPKAGTSPRSPHQQLLAVETKAVCAGRSSSPKSPLVEKLMKRLSSTAKQDWTSTPQDAGIPEYQAEEDIFCTYTETKAFKESPYFKLKLSEKHRRATELDVNNFIHPPDVSGLMDFDQESPMSSLSMKESNLLRKKRPRVVVGGAEKDSRGSKAGSAVGLYEMKIMKLIFLREGLVESLQKQCRKAQKRIKIGISAGGWDSVAIDAHLHAAATSMASTIDALRVRTVQVGEAIQEWREIIRKNGEQNEQSESPIREHAEIQPWLWKDCNYILKMTVDTTFLSLPFARQRKNFLQCLGLARSRNPLFTIMTLDELVDRASKPHDKDNEQQKEDSYASFPLAICRRKEDACYISEDRLVNAAKLFVDEEAAFGRIAPLEYSSQDADVLEPALSSSSPASTFMPQFQRQHSQDDLDWDIGKNNPTDRRKRVIPSETSMKETSYTLAGRPTSSLSTARRGMSRPGSASFTLSLGRPDGISGMLRTDTGVLAIRAHHIVQLREQPSELAQGILGAVRVLLLNPREPIPPKREFQWRRLVDYLLIDELKLMQQLASFNAQKYITVSKAKFLQSLFKDPRFEPERIRPHSEAAALLCSWCLVHAAKYVLSPELCFDYQDHIKVDPKLFTQVIMELQKEIQELKNTVRRSQIVNGLDDQPTSQLWMKVVEPGQFVVRSAFRLGDVHQQLKQVLVKLSWTPSQGKVRVSVSSLCSPLEIGLQLCTGVVNAIIGLESQTGAPQSLLLRHNRLDIQAQRNLAQTLVERLSATFQLQTEINVFHPPDGIKISGALLHFKVRVCLRGNIHLRGVELPGTITTCDIPEDIDRPLALVVSAEQYESLGFPRFEELCKRLSIRIGDQGVKQLVLDTVLWEKENHFISGHQVKARLSAHHNHIVLDVWKTENEPKQVSKETTMHTLYQYMSRPQDFGKGRPEDDCACFESAMAAVMLLPWPLAPSKLRLEFSDWKEEGVPLNVFLDDLNIAQLALGPRSSFYDARVQIENADIKRLEGKKFLFTSCPSRRDEASTNVLSTVYPDVKIYTVEEYSDAEGGNGSETDESSEDDWSSSDGEEGISNSVRRKKRQGGNKKERKRSGKSGSSKRRRKGRRKARKRPLIDSLLEKKSAQKDVEDTSESPKPPPEEELSQEEKKAEEEVQRKRKETLHFEDLEKLPGKVTIRLGGLDLCSSVDLLNHITRGDELIVAGTRCKVSTDKSRPFNPCTVPLTAPFEHPPPKTETSADVQENKDEESKDALQDVEAFKVIKIPAKAAEVKDVVVSIAIGSTELHTKGDLRYKLKPGDLIRLNGSWMGRVSRDPLADFHQDKITLESAFDGEQDLEDTRIDRVTLVQLSEKERQKSVAQKEKEKQEAKARKALEEEELRRKETFFGYTVSWRRLVPLLGSGPLHMRQQDFWTLVTPEFAVGEMYNVMCKQWFPPSEGLDNVKWVKLFRQLPGVSKDQISSTDLDLIFTKSITKGERRLTQEEFVSVALPQVAVKQYPWLDEGFATKKFVAEVFLEWAETQRVMWKEARRLAIAQEARRHCASLKMQAFARGRAARLMFVRKQHATFVLQKQLKSYRDKSKFSALLAASRQAKEIKRAEARAKRVARRESRIYSQVRLIGGIRNIVSVFRHTRGAIVIICYSPADCVTYKFTVPQEALRKTIEDSISRGDLADTELYEERHLEFILQRLQYRKKMDSRPIVLGRKPNTESGNKLAVQGVYVHCTDKTKQLFIVTVTEARGDYSFHAYDPVSTKTKSIVLSRHSLIKWLHLDEADDTQTVPELLRPEKKGELVQWLLARLLLCKGCALHTHYGYHRRKESVLMLEHDVAEQRDINMACKLQGMWRRRTSRRVVFDLISRAYRKQFDRSSNRWYYVRFDTGELSWERPKLLGSWDLPDPPDRWEEAYDQQGNRYYYHPLTGRTSWISEHDAAVAVQRLYRKRQAKEFRVPLPELVKIMTFQHKSEASYEEKPDRLASIVNYALLLHSRDHNYKEAQRLYKVALDRAPNSPLVLFSSAVLELANNSYPRKKTFDAAMRQCSEGLRHDPELAKFKVAYRSFFFFAAVAQPSNPQVWLNMAIIHQCIFKSYDLAEKYYRKAIDMDPTCQSIVDNFDDFQENRLPGGRFSGGGPGVMVTKRSVEVQRDGEWVLMEDPQAKHQGFARFWFNESTQKTQWQEPNWTMEWISRRKRASLQSQKDGWGQYHDPISNQLFYYHQTSGTGTWECPAYLMSAFGFL